MRNYKKLVYSVVLSSVMVLCACGTNDDATINSTKGNVVSDATDSTQLTTLKESETVVEQETTGDNENNSDIDVVYELEGFYNCINSENPFYRVDFEVKATDEGYMALFYSQYTLENVYDYGQILYGEKIDENTYEFIGTDEAYTVIWDGKDNLIIDGFDFGGEYERGVNDGYGEPEYIIADTPRYEADKYVENGIEIDSTLAGAIRKELGYDAEAILTYSDLESVTYLAAWDDVITSIKGISLLKNLEELNISTNYISDISEIAKLEHIRSVYIASGYIKEIPDLSKCDKLEALYLSGNMIEDVSPVVKMPSIKFLDLNGNLIKSIEPLKDAKSLETLCIEGNCILDYASIKDCTSLIDAYNQGAQGSYEQALEVENKAKKIVESFPSELSELELEKVIYKYVKDNMYYDDSERPMGAYGYSGILEGWGVCGDYAEMFDLLANHAGLESYNCGSETHAWNIVKIDGSYYHCDALWDEDVVEWTHFNKSTGYMFNLPDHMHDLRRYPMCEKSMSVLEYCDSFGVQ